MSSSVARIEANRKNALRSTGPKTAEGKERSRANALKHGMTGDGVVVPEADAAEVAMVEAELHDQLQPRDAVGRILVRRAAVLAVRMERCGQHELAMAAQRVRDAAHDRDDRRRAEVEQIGQSLAVGSDPRDAVRRLCRTPEGIEWLDRAWRSVRAEVARPAPEAEGLAERVGALMGYGKSDPRDADLDRWCAALGESDPAAADAARGPIFGLIDQEIALLGELRADIDDDAEAADRAEATARALFDPSRDAERARRYEAAAERGFFRALREIRQTQTAIPLPTPASPPPSVPTPTSTPARVPSPAPAAAAMAMAWDEDDDDLLGEDEARRLASELVARIVGTGAMAGDKTNPIAGLAGPLLCATR